MKPLIMACTGKTSIWWLVAGAGGTLIKALIMKCIDKTSIWWLVAGGWLLLVDN